MAAIIQPIITGGSVTKAVISGTGLYTPAASISNEELVDSFNIYVRDFNAKHASEIAEGKLEALAESDPDFIFKASGIKSRYVIDKAGILTLEIMHPVFQARSDEEISLQAEIGVVAARQALVNANKQAADIDAVILSGTNLQRPYPSIAIEIQKALGCQGYAFDMSVACSSVTFGLQSAVAAVVSGMANCVLVVTSEISSPQLNFHDRESHFIFGDAATAVIVERSDQCQSKHAFEIVDIKLKTEFSNNIRCNFGYMNRVETGPEAQGPKLFKQQGRKVFKEVVPMVVDLVTQHLAQNQIKPEQLKRLWLHQANANMNRLIATKILGYEPDLEKAPIILDEYANTASAGVAIVLHKNHVDMQSGDLGILCSFGAGYSIGNVILRKI